jgi:hypothetical protein
MAGLATQPVPLTPMLTKQIESEAAPMDSPFFSLPPEIRNCIYEYALGEESRTFSYNGDLVVAVPQFPPRVLTYEDRKVSGLPPWILAGKELCAEAIDVFTRSRAFESISPHSIVNNHRLAQPAAKQGTVDPPKPTNPLIFKEDGIQIIGLRPARHTGCFRDRTGTATVRRASNEAVAKFLQLMKEYGTRNMCLVMEWERYWDMRGPSYSSPASDWIDRENNILDHPCFNDEWTGKFRKVTIKIKYHSKDGNATERWLSWLK